MKCELYPSFFFSFQNEVSLLRNEVAHLKQLLLAHKDCPVTTLQKKNAYLGETPTHRLICPKVIHNYM